MIRVLALTRYGRLGASSRLRFTQFVPALHRLNIAVVVSPLLDDDYIRRLYSGKNKSWGSIIARYVQRIGVLIHCRKYDLLWIEKELFPDLPAFAERLLKFLGINFVVDFDDAIFHSYDLSRNSWRRILSKKIDFVMRDSSKVICGNAYLAERALSARALCVEIIPTVVDLERYFVAQRSPSHCITVGWIGSRATVKYLDEILPALQQVAKQFPIRLCVVGAQISLPNVETRCIPWSEANEVESIQGFDIGIMPLADTPWEQGKCGYKLIQYMACGVSVLASPVGVNQEIVRPGVNGYLCRDIGEWVECLERLCADPELRARLGGEGRKLVEAHYSLQVVVPRLASLMRCAVSQV